MRQGPIRRPTVIDVITDCEARPGVDPRLDRRGVFESIRRDLEDLLNTRLAWSDLEAYGRAPRHPDAFGLERTLTTYGLPDCADIALDESAATEEIRRRMQNAVECFEPRVHDPRVEIRDAGRDLATGAMGYLITGSVVFEDKPEAINYRIDADQAGTVHLETVDASRPRR